MTRQDQVDYAPTPPIMLSFAILILICIAVMLSGCRAPLIDNHRAVNIYMTGTNTVNAETLVEKAIGNEVQASASGKIGL